MPDTLISESVVLDAVDEITAMVNEHAAIYGDDAQQVKLGRWITARVQRGVEQAREHYLGIPAAADASGWHEQTIRRYASMAVAGETPPAPWSGLRVRGRKGGPYSVLVSTIPPHPR